MTDATSTQRVTALEFIGITKRFRDVLALDNASLAVRAGTVHALLGENGAGKTTLARLALGMLRPDSGRLELFGSAREWSSPRQAIDAGIGMVHQHFTLVPAMTVAENVELGADPPQGRSRWYFSDVEAIERVRALSEASGLVIDPTRLVAALSVSAQQRVEILKALRRSTRLLILDEPTAVLAPREIDDFSRWLRTYVEAGGTAILITHKLREALAVADEVTVLRRGQTVLATGRDGVDEGRLVEAMLGGRPLPAVTRSPREVQPRKQAEPIAQLDNIDAVNETRRERIYNVSVAIRPGDFVGIAGIDGAGQATLLRVLAGRINPLTGRVMIPPDVGFIPEDRLSDGLVSDLSLAENVALRHAAKRQGRIRWGAIRAQTAGLITTFGIHAPGVDVKAHTLSGGNQQRLIVARELEGLPRLIVAENPTRGLDIEAAASVLQQLQAASARGAAVVLYSSDLEEVLSVASRVLAVHAGKVREVVSDKDTVGRAMIGIA